MQRDTDMVTIGQKGAALEGGNATDEAIASSRTILAPGRNGKARGTQQYFTPPEAARWIANVIGQCAVVLDPTAGNGALMVGFDTERRHGVELDADQIRAANRDKSTRYAATQGDLQHIYPLLAKLGAVVPAIVCNPPFGLAWDVPGLGAGSSTKLAWDMCRALVRNDGAIAFICGTDRIAREGLDTSRVVARVDVARLFPDIDLPCTILFAAGRDVDNAPECFEAGTARDLTPGMAGEVRNAFYSAGAYLSGLRHETGAYPLAELLGAASAEYQRALPGRLALQRDTVELRGNRLASKPSAFALIKLATRGESSTAAWLRSFSGHPVEYFALQTREWRRLRELAADPDLGITLAPGVVRAVEAAIVTGQRDAMPLYPVTPVQRLGFLADVDSIACTVGDPARGYVAGESYPIECRTDVAQSLSKREVQTKEGPDLVDVVTSRRFMALTIGDHTFTDTEGADLTYILGHFHVPDPGDVATRFPAETAYWKAIVSRVEAEIQSYAPGFALRWFQADDIARLCLKGRGVNAWEQGCGKALGQLAWARSLEVAGRLPDGCSLFVMPQDLILQFRTEARRFFGRELLVIDRAATRIPRGGVKTSSGRTAKVGATVSAATVAEMVRGRRADLRAQRQGVHLAPRPSVWAVTWYEALAVSGRQDEPSPVARVRREWGVIERGEPERGGWVDGDYVTTPAIPSVMGWVDVTTLAECPRCNSTAADGWDGRICRGEMLSPSERRERIAWEMERQRNPTHRPDAGDNRPRRIRRCNYVHRSEWVKSAYSQLAPVFRAVCVDEATKIKGDSLASKAIRAFRPPFRMAATGTPFKNKVSDLFWLLWWTLGDSSARFPYAYSGGPALFTEDYGVFEATFNKQGKKGTPRLKDEVSNLLRLWKMLGGSMVRRRMDEIGAVVEVDGAWTCPGCDREQRTDVGAVYCKPDRVTCEACGRAWDTVAPIVYKPLDVPWGVEQLKQYAKWLNKDNFAAWFEDTHPDSPIVLNSPKMIPILAAGIGQLAKLDYACTDPSGDVDAADYWKLHPSHWTPGRLQILELALKHVRAGEKVLIGSCQVAPGPWIADRLNEAGVRATHITDEAEDGSLTTQAPKKRAAAIAAFKEGAADVLCVGVNAISLGHNLDCASVAIVDGLPWDFATWDQFVKRVRRLTSKKPITVYVILPPQSLAARKWQVLGDKTKASDLTLDGKLSDAHHETIDKAAILAELQEKGITADGSEVRESDVHARWAAIKAGAVPVDTMPAPAATRKPRKERTPTPRVRKAAPTRETWTEGVFPAGTIQGTRNVSGLIRGPWGIGRLEPTAPFRLTHIPTGRATSPDKPRPSEKRLQRFAAHLDAGPFDWAGLTMDRVDAMTATDTARMREAHAAAWEASADPKRELVTRKPAHTVAAVAVAPPAPALREVTIAVEGMAPESLLYDGPGRSATDKALCDALAMYAPAWPDRVEPEPDPDDAILAELEAETTDRMRLMSLGCEPDRCPDDYPADGDTEPVTERMPSAGDTVAVLESLRADRDAEVADIARETELLRAQWRWVDDAIVCDTD